MPDLARSVHERLLAAGQSVACAESLTGGELAALLSGTPGASETFRGGVVSYATEVKRSVLGVTADRVVSAMSALEMSGGVRSLLGADWGVSTTGVAGPTEQEGQPVGTVFIGLTGPGLGKVRECHFEGDRTQIRAQACQAALEVLLDVV